MSTKSLSADDEKYLNPNLNQEQVNALIDIKNRLHLNDMTLKCGVDLYFSDSASKNTSDIKTIIKLCNEVLKEDHCSLDKHKNTHNNTFLDLACYNWQHVPTDLIELMLKNGAEPNKLFIVEMCYVIEDPIWKEGHILRSAFDMGHAYREEFASHILLHLKKYTECPDDKMKEITRLFIRHGVEECYVPEDYHYLFNEIKEKNN